MSTQRTNSHEQPIGFDLGLWTPPPRPGREAWEGHWSRLEPLDPDVHARELFDALAEDPSGRGWTYLAYGPFGSFAEYREWLRRESSGDDPLFFAIRDLEHGRATGLAAYLRIAPTFGSIEVGHVCYAPALQRTRAGTEAMYAMMKRAFDLGYRRYEWKCDSLNAASERAARRYGFQYEGTFRQAAVYKGRNRDTAWFSVLDGEWPRVRERFERWLAPENFDGDGRQRTPLGR